MIRRSRYGMLAVLAVACLGVGCRAQVQVQRPDTVAIRMIEPRLGEPGGVAADAPNATSVRLLETQGRGHIGRRVLHQQPGGEVTEDPVWLWASTPDRYLDSAVRYAIASSPDIRLVDVRSAPSLAVTLVAWQIEAAPSPRLVGAVEVQVTTADRAVHSEIIRAEEPITADLPGDLATAAGRLLWRLATDCLSRVTHPILIGGLRTTDKGRGYTEMKAALAAAAYDAFQNCSRFSQWCRAESPPTSR